MTELAKETCSSCEIGAPLVPHDQQMELLNDLDGWIIDTLDISKLKKEQTLLQNKLINLYENKKRILKKLKIYKKDLDNKIIELESIKNEQTSIPLTANNEFQIIDVVPSKVDF